MNIYQMQALDYVLKENKYLNKVDFNYIIIFKMNNELYEADFLEVDKSGVILENPTITPTGGISQFEYYYDSYKESPLKKANIQVFPRQGGPYSRKLQNILIEGKSLHLIHKSLLEVIENTKGTNNLDPIIYNVKSLTHGYQLPYMLIDESTEFEWISLDKKEN